MSHTILKLSNVSLHKPGLSQPILDDINYEVCEGDFVILLGSNGSGKSSLLKVIDGRYQKTTGNVSFNSVSDMKPVTTVTQNSEDALFAPLTVYENYLLIADNAGTRQSCADYLKVFNPKLADKLDDLVFRLSGGEKQALVLALATFETSQLLLLDEHTAALDPVTSERLMKLTDKIVTEKKLTCVMTTHDLNDAIRYGNRIVSLQHGKVHATIEEAEKKNMTVEKLLEICY